MSGKAVQSPKARPSSNDQMGQTCKACGRRDKFDFIVPDAVWSAVVPEALKNRVVCLACFDTFARKRGVNYAPHLRALYFAGDSCCFEFGVNRSSVVQD